MTRGSLRRRLFLTIIGPLMIAACLAGLFRYSEFTRLSRTLYDNTLLSIAIAISRSVAVSEGDLVARSVLESLSRSLGDRVWYRVIGPDEAYLTGYSDAPPLPPGPGPTPGKPRYFDAQYFGQPVRVLAMQEFVSDDHQAGQMAIEIWQTVHQRDALSFQLIGQSVLYFGLIVAIGAVAIWIGIGTGLRPLRAVERAIRLRNPEDLRPTTQEVPAELETLIAAMNGLFGRMSRLLARRDAFISDAAHQLRTPIAAILAQSEAAALAKDETALRARLDDVTRAARRASRLSQQLLSLERAKAQDIARTDTPVDLAQLSREVMRSFAERVLPTGLDVEYRLHGTPRPCLGDPVLLGEMIANLLDNAGRYCDNPAPRVILDLAFAADGIALRIIDNGSGLPPDLHERVFDRFYRATPSGAGGSGLGLAIVREIAHRHGGTACVDPQEGFCILVRLP